MSVATKLKSLATGARPSGFKAAVEQARAADEELRALPSGKLSAAAALRAACAHAGVSEAQAAEDDRIVAGAAVLNDFAEAAARLMRARTWDPPTDNYRAIVSGDLAALTEVQLAALEGGLTSKPLARLVAVGVLRAVRQWPEAFGAVESSVAENEAARRVLEARFEAALAEMRAGWTHEDVELRPVGSGLFRATYLWGGNNTDISVDDPAALVRWLAAQ
jgi:hypothetical protein